MLKTEDLNIEQQQAVGHMEGPMLVLAGAGSGKTRIVTHRILHLLEVGIPASEILAMTFTNKAADEMSSRIYRLSHARVLTCTFHSLCARILRESITALGFLRDFVIFDEDDSEKVLKECFVAFSLKDEKGLLKKTRSQISSAKNQLTAPEDLSDQDGDLKKVYALYQEKLKHYNALDFDDLLFTTVKLFKTYPDILASYQKRWSFILIDEYQDTNHAQYMITKMLVGEKQNIFAVGDPDQSIYSWRGANIQNILRFKEDFPGASIVTLEQNYRSRSNILEAANALIKNNESRYEKNLWSTRGVGEKISLFLAGNEQQEADFVTKKIRYLHEREQIPLNECAIFYRTNFQSRSFEDALLREKIPYLIIGGLSFYQRKEIKDVLALLRIIIGSSDMIAFSRTINTPRRGFGETTLSRIKELAFAHSINILQTCDKILARELDAKLSKKQMDNLQEYIYAIFTMREMIKTSKPIDEIISSAIERFKYLDHLKEDQETFEERRDNIQELIAKAAEWQAQAHFPDLAAFLEELTLKSNVDDSSKSQDSVKLMTFHNGKGLEFSAVFLVGMEEDLFPHINVKENAKDLEEERRLCYVGITRAKDHLFLTAARYRFLWGSSRSMRPSRFLKEIPSKYLQLFSETRKSEEEEPREDTAFRVGDAVFHKDFGSGVIQKVYNTSLGLTFDVFFSKAHTTRSLVAKYAKLAAL